MSEEQQVQSSAVLRFDHNVIEHLGVKLYQNKLLNVLAELLANSWDADAKRVEITAKDKMISIADSGVGMDYPTIRDNYLVIGKAKRKSPTDRSPGNRAPMGRKGIGKLAPFGIARNVDVVTVRGAQVNWFTLDVDAMLQQKGASGEYMPVFYCENQPLDAAILECSSSNQSIKDFLAKVLEWSDKSGTLILMSRLTIGDLPSIEEIQKGLVNRFTVVLARQDFNVSVNDKTITPENAMPKFELRIPESTQPYAIEKVGGKEVRYWAGFVEAADWSSDEAGVGVFVHGKIGQDRPFFFGAKGKEIYQRYLYSVVEADWLDELPHDLVSTDRTSINWEDPEAKALREWGKQKVGEWLSAFTSFRESKHKGEVKQIAEQRRKERAIPSFSESENRSIDELVANATRDLGKGKLADKARDELLGAVSQAWMNLPARQLLKDLWETLNESSESGQQFADVASKLREHSVPEAMNLALMFAQRAYALSLLYDLVHRQSETNLQLLVEEFPWILQPRGELLTANQQLKTTMERSADELGNNAPARVGQIIKGMSGKERADFVYLTDATSKEIQIIEIKGPDHALSVENHRQLVDYLDYTTYFHADANIYGLLIGNPGKPPFKPTDNRVAVRGWDEILTECRAAYIEMLAALLADANPTANDTRLNLVREFGGKETWELLGRMAAKDERLAELMKKMSALQPATKA